MKVYVLIYDGDEYESGRVFGAFSSKDAAKQRVSSLDIMHRLDAQLIELTIDEPVEIKVGGQVQQEPGEPRE